MFGNGVKLILLQKLRNKVCLTDSDLTTEDVWKNYLQIWTQNSQLSFVDDLKQFNENKNMLELTEVDLIDSKPNVYVSHSWKSNFNSLVSRLEEYCEKLKQEDVQNETERDEPIFWIDILCSNQWKTHLHDISYYNIHIDLGIKEIGRSVFIFSINKLDEQKPFQNSLLNRTTCLFDMYCTLKHLIEYDIVGTQEDLQILLKTLQNSTSNQFIHLLTSESSTEEEKLIILQTIQQIFQNQTTESVAFDEWFDSQLYQFLVDWKKVQEITATANNELKESLESLEISPPPSLPEENHLKPSNDSTTAATPAPAAVQEGVVIDIDKETLIMFTCPYEFCQGTITVAPNQINCGVFRHGVYKQSGRPIGPHLSKEKCLELIRQNKVHGCAQPFRIRKVREVPLEKNEKEVKGGEEEERGNDNGEKKQETEEEKKTAEAKAESEMKGEEVKEGVEQKEGEEKEEETEKGQGKKGKNKKQQKKQNNNKQNNNPHHFRYFIETCGYV